MAEERQIPGSERRPSKRAFQYLFLALMLIQTATAVFFCFQKKGMHYDEYFSYYASNGTLPMVMRDREWNDVTYIREAMVSTDGESFHYGAVYRNQERDVHPPFYYFMLHTLSSFFPGVYSKWIGLGLNLACFVISLFLAADIARRLSGSGAISLLSLAVYGFSPGVLSGVTFIRMYMLLALLILFFVWLHIRYYEDRRSYNLKIMVPLMLCVFLGFLTQYYFAVFMFFFCAATCVCLLFHDRSFKGFLRYALSMLLPLFAAVAFYPASLDHIFNGYRGKDVQNAFLDAGNLWERFRYFTALTDQVVFSHTMWILAGVFLCGFVLGAVVYKTRLRRIQIFKGIPASGWVTGISVLCYYLLISKITLMLGDESNRYFVPVYGLLLIMTVLSFVWLFKLWQGILPGRLRLLSAGPAVLLSVFLLIDLYGYTHGSILHLYVEQEGNLKYAKAHSGDEVLILSRDCWIWNNIDELLCYDSVYYLEDSDMSPIEDERIKNSDSLTAYVNNQNEDMTGDYLGLILESTGFTSCRLEYQTKFYDIYSFQ